MLLKRVEPVKFVSGKVYCIWKRIIPERGAGVTTPSIWTTFKNVISMFYQFTDLANSYNLQYKSYISSL